MLKSLCTALVISFVTLLGACSFGDGTVEGCATAMTGTFEGTSADEEPVPVEGLIFGYFEPDPETGDLLLEVKFLVPDDTPEDSTDNSTRSKTLDVGSDGSITAVGGSTLMQFTDASMNLDSCTLTGSWEDSFIGMGTFSVGAYQVL